MFLIKKKDTPVTPQPIARPAQGSQPAAQQGVKPMPIPMSRPATTPAQGTGTAVGTQPTTRPMMPPVQTGAAQPQRIATNPAQQPATAQPTAAPQMPQQTTASTQQATDTPTPEQTQPEVTAPIAPSPAPDYSKYAPSPEQRQATQKPVEEETVTVETKEHNYEPYTDTLPDGKRVFRAKSVSHVNFADCWFTPENILYIRDKATKFALIPFEAEDADEFYRTLEQGYTGASSYAIRFLGEQYRVERIMTTTGVQYNCRKMPTSTPNLFKLGIPDPITKYLATLAPQAGLILFGGPTGMGKTTTASALMKEFLEEHGGFLYTIEDPPEMPLDGLYYARNGALGLCKQCPVENEHWEDGLKSALRSKPRYILVGEIRSPEVASQTLRAATSGHLVLSTIHATSVEDALNSMIKYAMGSGLDQELVSDLLARGILAVIHQKLEGTTKLHPVIHTVFANPNPLAPDQLRNAIREGKISLGTLMEAQSTRMFKGMSMFKDM